MKTVILLLFSILLNFSVHAQDSLVQFSGVVMTSDSLRGIPYVTISKKNTNRGTISNLKGFFSFVAEAGDTIVFSAIGFKKDEYAIPEDLQKTKYSVIKLLTRDTVHLPETIIYPWPTKEHFKEAFLRLDIPDDDLIRARKNLEDEILREKGEHMAMDAKENYDFLMRQQAEKFFYNGQYPPMEIFNPMAWVEFIRAWKEGEFREE